MCGHDCCVVLNILHVFLYSVCNELEISFLYYENTFENI